MEAPIVVYGSYGYTGRLIVRECLRKGLSILLSGRDSEKLRKQSEETGYPFEAVSLDHAGSLRQLLSRVKLVIHCTGPFKYTAPAMVQACLETHTHYTDITGEFEVFELLADYHDKARAASIVVLPGVGFDVVPSDCLALFLKNQLPQANHLQLAFAMSKGGLSRGTAKTMVESLGEGTTIRQDGKLISVPMGKKVMAVNFGPFTREAMCIPWGDIVTAWHSTQTPTIEVYSAAPAKAIKMAALSRYFSFFLRQQWLKRYLRKKVDARPAGPDEHALATSRSYLWGRATAPDGTQVEARLETINAYALTAATAVLIASKILEAAPKAGFSTPAKYFGPDLILEVPNSKRTFV